MVRQKITITESEKNRIAGLYIQKPKRNYVFEMYITVDGRYIVVEDEVFDNIEQRVIGNLWESIDTFKTIFQNTKVENSEFDIIRESFVSLPILENHQNLYGLRDILLEFNFMDDTWFGKQLKSAGKGISDFVTTSYEGLKKFGIAISKGNWGEILKLLASGVKYLFRKLKDAMYSNIGMIVDGILIATGVGKAVQWIPWALITALDIYQIAFNDWPEEEANSPMWLKYLTLGFDILGLVTTGIAAKNARTATKVLERFASNPEALAKYVAENPKIGKIISGMIGSSSGAISKLEAAKTALNGKFPKGAQFMEKSLTNSKSVIDGFKGSMGKLISGKALKSGAKTTGVLYGLEKGIEYGTELFTGVGKQERESMSAASNFLKSSGY
jgi:hypothetical protein